MRNGGACMNITRVFVGALVAWVLWPAANSHACAVCGCGDPTLTVAGAEKPLAQRVRTGAEVRVLEDRWADVDGGGTVMRDARVTALVAYAPLRSIIFVAAVAGVVRDVTLPNLARVVTAGLGDVDLRARVFVFQDRAFSPRHVVSIQGGVILPTATAWARPKAWTAAALKGAAFPSGLPDSAIPGLFAVMPVVGLTYGAFHQGKYALQVSLQAQFPVAFTSSTRVGGIVNASVSAQWQPVGALALRALADARLSAATVTGGRQDANAGGLVGFGGGEVVVSPWMDLQFNAALRVPVVQLLNGTQSVGPVMSLGVMRDW